MTFRPRGAAPTGAGPSFFGAAPAFLGAFLLSGASGLVYEIVWTRRLSVIVGGTAYATQAVLSTFFAGLTLGALTLGRRAARSPDGARFYRRLELGIAALGVLSLVALEALAPLARLWTAGHERADTALCAFALTGVACLPTTLLMGATFPAVSRALRQAAVQDPAALLGVGYAANTLGAVVGALGAAFALLPALGVRGTLAVAVAGNLAAAALVWRPGARPASAPPGAAPAADPPARRPARGLAVAVAASGFAAIALQVLAFRVLAVTLSDTVYTFALGLAAYILGAALASALFARISAALGRAPAGLWLAGAAALSTLWLWTLRAATPLHAALAPEAAGFVDTLLAEGAVALFVAFPAAVPTSLVFLELARRASGDNPAAGAAWATIWNGLGCALAPFLAALLLLPALGSAGVGVVAVAALAVGALALLPGTTRPGRARVVALVLLAVPGAGLLGARGALFGWYVTPGWSLLWKKEGATAAVSVEEAPNGQRRLRTNNNFGEGGDGGAVSQKWQGLLPALLRPDAREVLALGVGSGITLGGAVAALPEARFDAVELIPEIRTAVGFFDRAHGGVGAQPQVTLHVADARSFAAHARARRRRYDLVMGELFHGVQAGTGALYAREHFEAVRALLTEGGLYCQWVPLHELPPAQVRTVVRTFFAVFPEGVAFFGAWAPYTPLLALVGGDRRPTLDLPATARWLDAHPTRARVAAESQVARLDRLLGTYVGDAAALRAWAGPGPHNTDDRPELELRGPRERTPVAMGSANAVALLEARRRPETWVDGLDEDGRARVGAFWEATGDFYRGVHAGLGGDLDAAERALLRALDRAPALDAVTALLRTLADRWAEAGRPDRARALRARVTADAR